MTGRPVFLPRLPPVFRGTPCAYGFIGESEAVPCRRALRSPLRASVQAQADANLLVNGSFEMAPVLLGGAQHCPGSEDISGWTVIRGCVDVVSSTLHWQQRDGEQGLDLAGARSVGGVAQTFSTTPGKSYVASFCLAGNPDPDALVSGCPAIRRMRVLAAFAVDAVRNFCGEGQGGTVFDPDVCSHLEASLEVCDDNPSGELFVRGDANTDGRTDIRDAL